jgi:hypothetical protein
MAEQGSYPLNGRTVAGTDTVTGVVAGQTADIPLSVLAAYVLSGGGESQLSGTTAARLALTPSFIGQPFFDTTLGYMMWVKQIQPAVWVNAAGVAE